MVVNPTRRALTLGALSAAFAACTPLDAFNKVIPYDEGSVQIAQNVAYGPNKRQQLDIYGPRDLRKSAPVVVFYYGGSWNSGRRQDYAFVGHALAAEGFVTVIPDYRLVPAIAYPVFLEDCASALAWVHREIEIHGGDASRLFLVGHSAGAYNAMMLATAGELLAPHGLTSAEIAGVAALAGPYDFLPLRYRATKQAFAGVSDLQATQPINRLTAEAPPLFLASGADDTLVEPRNSAVLAQRAREIGVPVVEKSYPGVGHAGLLLALAQPLREHAPVLANMLSFFRSAKSS
jgi:acetyl esterase/lipase